MGTKNIQGKPVVPTCKSVFFFENLTAFIRKAFIKAVVIIGDFEELPRFGLLLVYLPAQRCYDVVLY